MTDFVHWSETASGRMEMAQDPNLMKRLKKLFPVKCPKCGSAAVQMFVHIRCVMEGCDNYCPSEREEYIKMVDEWFEETTREIERAIEQTPGQQLFFDDLTDVDPDAETDPQIFGLTGSIDHVSDDDDSFLITFDNGSVIKVGASIREIDKLRGKKYRPVSEIDGPANYSLRKYLEDVLIPASIPDGFPKLNLTYGDAKLDANICKAIIETKFPRDAAGATWICPLQDQYLGMFHVGKRYEAHGHVLVCVNIDRVKGRLELDIEKW